MIDAICDLIITGSTKLFLAGSAASGDVRAIVLAAFCFVFVGPLVYGLFFGEPLSWVECYKDGNWFGFLITIGIYKFKRR